MITQHAATRITHRLAGIVTRSDIRHIDKVSSKLNSRKWYIRVRRLDKVHQVIGSTGDCLTFIVEGNNVVTAMLSDNSQRWNDGTFKVLLTQ